MRILLDTNVILDFFLEREPFFQNADALFEEIAAERLKGFTTGSSATDIFYICKRQTQNLSRAREVMAKVLETLDVCPVDQTILETALNSGLADFEDAVQIACAVTQQLDAIVTRNSRDFQTTEILIMTVGELLERQLDDRDE